MTRTPAEAEQENKSGAEEGGGGTSTDKKKELAPSSGFLEFCILYFVFFFMFVFCIFCIFFPHFLVFCIFVLCLVAAPAPGSENVNSSLDSAIPPLCRNLVIIIPHCCQLQAVLSHHSARRRAFSSSCRMASLLIRLACFMFLLRPVEGNTGVAAQILDTNPRDRQAGVSRCPT